MAICQKLLIVKTQYVLQHAVFINNHVKKLNNKVDCKMEQFVLLIDIM